MLNKSYTKMDYSDLCKTYKELEEHSSRLEKIDILKEFLQKLKKEKNKEIIYLLQGRAYPSFEKQELGISTQLIKKAISKSTGTDEKKVNKLFKEKGDLGDVAEQLVDKKSQTTLSKSKLTTEKVLENLKKLPEFEGQGTVEKKVSTVSELLTSAAPLEAKYIVRTVLNELRIGVGESTIKDAITEACLDEKSKENTSLVQQAIDKTADLALVFEKACKSKKALEETELIPGKPVKVMLFQKEETAEKGFDRVGKPALIEYKYDGFRLMINKYKENSKTKIKLFTRRLEEVTKQFPEVAEYVKKNIKAETFILDTEAVGYDPKSKEYLPFQNISQRIKRKYNIEELQKKLPIEVNVFDVLYYNGKPYLKKPLKERRKIIEKIVKNKEYKIRVSKAITTSDIDKAEEFYQKALEDGQEGVMMKNLDAEYKPGSRVGYGIKIKPTENDFDLVITGAEYGTGKRAGWLTSYDVSCLDEDSGDYKEIGKVSTGLKEKESEGLSYKQMTEKLKQEIIKIEGKHVQVYPKLIVTVTYQNIQKSPKYNSGFALRFPRFTRLRPDRKPDDIATLEEVKKEYSK